MHVSRLRFVFVYAQFPRSPAEIQTIQRGNLLFRSIRDSLSRTRNSVFGQIAGVLGTGDITEETWEDLEALLIQADVGVPTTLQIVEAMQQQVKQEGLYKNEQLMVALKKELRTILTSDAQYLPAYCRYDCRC